MILPIWHIGEVSDIQGDARLPIRTERRSAVAASVPRAFKAGGWSGPGRYREAEASSLDREVLNGMALVTARTQRAVVSVIVAVANAADR